LKNSPLRSITHYEIHLIIMLVILGSISLDLSMGRASIFFTQSTLNQQVITLFALSFVLVPAQFLLIWLTRRKGQFKYMGDTYLLFIRRALLIVQVGLTLILIVVLLEVFLDQRYNSTLLILSTSMSYGLSIVVLSVLVKRFLSWSRKNLHPVVLLYTLSFAVIILNIFTTMLLVDVELPRRPDMIGPHIGTTIMFIPGSLNATLNGIQTISLIVGFTLMWGATSMLLRNYSRKLGRAIYWIIIGIPLAYFLSQYLSLFLDFFVPLLELDPYLL
jgi:hypothetical protein